MIKSWFVGDIAPTHTSENLPILERSTANKFAVRQSVPSDVLALRSASAPPRLALAKNRRRASDCPHKTFLIVGHCLAPNYNSAHRPIPPRTDGVSASWPNKEGTFCCV